MKILVSKGELRGAPAGGSSLNGVELIGDGIALLASHALFLVN